MPNPGGRGASGTSKVVARIKAEQPGFRAKLQAVKAKQEASANLKAQAATHRATKGTREERGAILLERAKASARKVMTPVKGSKARLEAWHQPRAKRTEFLRFLVKGK